MPKPALSFTTPVKELHALTPFEQDGELLHAVEPKGAQLMALLRDVDRTDQFGQIELIDSFMDLCLTEESATRLRERMDDPDDPFDVPELSNIIKALREVWGERPTGPSTPSSPSRRRTGTASTARSRRTA